MRWSKRWGTLRRCWHEAFDCLLYTSTANAAVRLLRQCGASVEAVAVLLELDALGGRSVLSDVTVETALHL